MKNSKFRGLLLYIILFGILLWAFSAFGSASKADYVSFAQMSDYFQQEAVTAFEVSDNKTVTLQLKDGTYKYHALAELTLFEDSLGDLIRDQKEAGIITDYNFERKAELPAWAQVALPAIISVVLVMVIWWLMAMKQQQAQGGGGGLNNFGKARTVNGQKSTVTFADVAGSDEEKAELQELVDFLKDPQKFIDLGARIPKGVLLVGPPGTGKTLLAKAVAGEAGAKLLSISGSALVAPYEGVGASRVRALFDLAKKESPAIVFIDETDAVAFS